MSTAKKKPAPKPQPKPKVKAKPKPKAKPRPRKPTPIKVVKIDFSGPLARVKKLEAGINLINNLKPKFSNGQHWTSWYNRTAADEAIQKQLDNATVIIAGLASIKDEQTDIIAALKQAKPLAKDPNGDQDYDYDEDDDPND